MKPTEEEREAALQAAMEATAKDVESMAKALGVSCSQ